MTKETTVDTIVAEMAILSSDAYDDMGDARTGAAIALGLVQMALRGDLKYSEDNGNWVIKPGYFAGKKREQEIICADFSEIICYYI